MLKQFLISALLTLCSSTANAQDHVWVTYYKLKGKTAAGTVPRRGIIAVSRDLLKKYPLHSTVKLEGYGRYVVEDVMGARSRRCVDIWSDKKIRNKRNVKLTLVSKPKKKRK